MAQITHTARLTKRWKVTFTFDAEAKKLVTEWEPRMPDTLSKKELRRYREERDVFMKLVAEDIGGNVVVVDT